MAFFTPGFGVGLGLTDFAGTVFLEVIPVMVRLISVAEGNFSSFPLSMAVMRHCPLVIPITVIAYLPVTLLNVVATLQTAGVCEITLSPIAKSGSLIAAEFSFSDSPSENLNGPAPLKAGNLGIVILVNIFSVTGSTSVSVGSISRI